MQFVSAKVRCIHFELPSVLQVSCVCTSPCTDCNRHGRLLRKVRYLLLEWHLNKLPVEKRLGL